MNESASKPRGPANQKDRAFTPNKAVAPAKFKTAAQIYKKQNTVVKNETADQQVPQGEARPKSGQRYQNNTTSMQVTGSDLNLATGGNERTSAENETLITLTEKVKHAYNKINRSRHFDPNTKAVLHSLQISEEKRKEKSQLKSSLSAKKQRKSFNFTQSYSHKNSSQENANESSNNHSALTSTRKIENQQQLDEGSVSQKMQVHHSKTPSRISDFALQRLKQNLMSSSRSHRQGRTEYSHNVSINKSFQHVSTSANQGLGSQKNVHQKAKEYRESIYQSGAQGMQIIRGLNGLDTLKNKVKLGLPRASLATGKTKGEAKQAAPGMLDQHVGPKSFHGVKRNVHMTQSNEHSQKLSKNPSSSKFELPAYTPSEQQSVIANQSQMNIDLGQYEDAMKKSAKSTGAPNKTKPDPACL